MSRRSHVKRAKVLRGRVLLFWRDGLFCGGNAEKWFRKYARLAQAMRGYYHNG